jgi:hypothetical protein
MLHDTIAPPPGHAPFDPARPAPWPEIDGGLLDERRRLVPTFPLDRLPAAWACWVGDTAQAAGTPADYVAQGLLAAVAAVCGAGVQVRVTPSWHESLVLWQALVGAPSSGKSPALAAARRQLAQIETLLRAEDPERQRRHAAKVEEARVLTETWREACAEAAKAGRPVPSKPIGASFDEPFVPGQLVVADATMEALADVVAGNPRGVILWRDELAAWLANLGRYANGGSDRAHWLEAWSAAGVTVNRRSRAQPLHLPKFPVSIVGTIQPDRIADVLNSSDDGMAARFLYAWPEAPGYTSLMDRRIPRDDDALGMLQYIARCAGSVTAPLILAFERTAVVAFDQFMRDLHGETRDADGLEAGWLGKGPGTVARLAAILTLLDWSAVGSGRTAPTRVAHHTVNDAAALWRGYFRPHALAVFNQAGNTDRDRDARRVIRWLRATCAREVGREQIRTEALSYSVDAEGADRVIARLEAGGILRLAAVAKVRHRPAKRWQVNPALR